MNIARITLFGRVQLVNPKATGVIPMAPAGGRVICRPLRYATPRRLSRVEPTTTVVITRPSFCDTKTTPSHSTSARATREQLWGSGTISNGRSAVCLCVTRNDSRRWLVAEADASAGPQPPLQAPRRVSLGARRSAQQPLRCWRRRPFLSGGANTFHCFASLFIGM